MTEQKTAEQLAKEQIKAVYEAGVATINGRDYVFTTATHKKRLKVFSYFTGVQHQLQKGDFSFMGDEYFEKIEQTICELVTFEGSLLVKKPNHWNEYAQDYLIFITTAMAVISYPFGKGES